MASDGQLVVVGVDGSGGSAGALRWAADYCASTGARGRATLTWHYPPAAGPAPIGHAPKPVTEDVRGQMMQTLAEAAPGAPLEQEVGYGHPAQVLVEQSADADLPSGRQPRAQHLQGILLGSVSMHCVTHAQCPVVVVRQHA